MERIPCLLDGFSTRLSAASKICGVALNLVYTRHGSRLTVARNRRAFLNKLRATHDGRPWPLVTLRQIHSDIIHCMTAPSQQTLAGDGLITRTPGIVLAILTADCLPWILADTKRPAIGVFHAG